MKYTVVIRQPVPESILPQLQDELQRGFGLSAEQAAKLASRRSGRLMKPNSRPRAERLYALFQAVGAQVSLEEVRDDTTFMADPFSAQRPGPLAPEHSPFGPPAGLGAAGPGAGLTSGAGAVAVLPPPPRSPVSADAWMGSAHAAPSPWDLLDHPAPDHLATDSSSSVTGAPAWKAVNPSGHDLPAPAPAAPLVAHHPAAHDLTVHPLTPPAHADGTFLPPDPLPTPVPFVQHDADLIVPTALPTSVPDMNLWTSPAAQAASWPVAADPHTAASPAAEPHLSNPALNGRSAHHTAVLADPLPFAASAPTAGAMQVVPVSASADDAWADFTGSLSSPAQPEAPVTAEAGVLKLEAPAETEAPRPGRRSSLARRVLVSALVPLLLFTAVTLAFIAYLVPAAQNRIIGDNAQAVAVAVGGNLDTSNQDTVNAQLDALIRRTSVGFVQVELPDGTSFFRSKNAASDGTLSEEVAAWVKAHPQTGSFTQSGSPADAFRAQLKDLEDVGAGQSAQAAALRQSIADPANQSSSTAHYVLSRVGVTENAQGARTVQTDVTPGERGLLYSIVVGVPTDTALTELRTTLLLVFGVALLAFVLAALLAARTARGVVQPIERLVRAADAISMGDLAQPVRAERNDEIGDLAQALERMRLSLDTAMERLRRRRTSR